MTHPLTKALECAQGAVNRANRLYAPDAKPQCPCCVSKERTFKVVVTWQGKHSEFAGCHCGWGMFWDDYVMVEGNPEETEAAKTYLLTAEIASGIYGT